MRSLHTETGDNLLIQPTQNAHTEAPFLLNSPSLPTHPYLSSSYIPPAFLHLFCVCIVLCFASLDDNVSTWRRHQITQRQRGKRRQVLNPVAMTSGGGGSYDRRFIPSSSSSSSSNSAETKEGPRSSLLSSTEVEEEERSRYYLSVRPLMVSLGQKENVAA